MPISLDDLLSATGGQLHGGVTADTWDDYCHDSRLARPGQLFVALRTTTGDGHDHIAEAVNGGCTGVLCQHAIADHPHVTTILTPDTGDALRAWAAHILRKFRPLVIAITGSNGKTTAKELAADLLERAYPGQVFRTRESYNDRLGIPLALGRLRLEHRLAILELGSDAYGEIAELAALTGPLIGAITTIGDAHFGTFGSIPSIAAEKSALIHALPVNGLAILNADDPHQQALIAACDVPVFSHCAHGQATLQLFSGDDDAVSASYLQAVLDISELAKLQAHSFHLLPQPFNVTPPVASGTFSLQSHLIGEHQLVPVRTAVAIALLLGVSVADIQAGVESFQPLAGRMRPLPGLGGSMLLDDTNSASPAGTCAALETLAAYKSKYRIAVLGQHSGLGPEGESLLKSLGAVVAESVDSLVLVGAQAQAIALGAQAHGFPDDAIYYADTPSAAAEVVRSMLGPDTICLLKGSREARLERTTKALLARPDTASDLLPRQNLAWQHLRLRNSLRPTWVEIDTLALADNVRAARALLRPGVQLMTVLKADAYGHGAATVARIVEQAGSDMLAVACLSEARALRRSNITMPILVLGYTPPWQARSAVELDIHLTVYDEDVASALNEAAAALDRVISVHVKVDTGMGRLGLLPGDVPEFLRFLHTLPHIDVRGMFTHMAVADEPDNPHTDLQLARFDALLAELEAERIRPPLVHAANTATLLARPDAQYNAVRLGIGLYGLSPAPDLPLPPGFRPVLSWKTTIAQVKTLPAGSPVGYGMTYRTEGEQTLAVIPVGYADGFRRAPKNWGYVLVRGQRAPLVGRVSMDQASIDITEIPAARPGDEVVLIGRQGDEIITADQVAERLGTINYEVISAILARVPRMPE